MKQVYIALDPVTASPVSQADSLDALRSKIASLTVNPEFASLKIPLYRCQLDGNKATHSVRVE